MSERRDGRPDDQKAFPEWLTELKDDGEDSSELHKAEQYRQRGWRFEAFPDDERREREERPTRSDRYDLL